MQSHKELFEIVRKQLPHIYNEISSEGLLDAIKTREQARIHKISGTTVLHILKQLCATLEPVEKAFHEDTVEKAFHEDTVEKASHEDSHDIAHVETAEPEAISAKPELEWDLAQTFLEQCQMAYGDAIIAQQNAEFVISLIRDALKMKTELHIEGIPHWDNDDVASIVNQLYQAALESATFEKDP